MHGLPKHKLIGLVIAGSPAFFASLLAVGWGGAKEAALFICLGIAAVGGALGGFIFGNTMRSRLIYPIPFVVGALGITATSIFYLGLRSSFLRIELVLPFVVGTIPGVIVYFIARPLAEGQS